jgi:hypothetical protein
LVTQQLIDSKQTWTEVDALSTQSSQKFQQALQAIASLGLNVGQKAIPTISIQSFHPSIPLLISDADVEAYISELRQQLLEAIQEGKQVIVHV